MKIIILLLLLLPMIVSAEPRPVSFTVDQTGEAFGTLEDGTSFSQTNIATDLGIRLQKFKWSQGFWYISDKGIIEIDHDSEVNYDLQAFSIYLTK